MPARSQSLAPLDFSHPGLFPPAAYGLGRDYAVPLLTRRALGRAGAHWLPGRATLPSPVPAAAGPRRPPG